MKWTKKRRGCAIVWVGDRTPHAVVDKKGFGSNPGVFWNGQKYPSVDAAKAAAEQDA